ncbi:MAG: bifunctional metallophosphatase/5'-nucleotidase [Ruminococcaceae bacterium]|nr:bifunctional metallophosphatase/5'-nucleotidase [Oscillospiraceae bacterium]
MKNHLKRLAAAILAAILLLSLSLPGAAASSATDITILFTHDLHSHLLPARSETGGTYGGYAKLMHVINQQKELHPDALLEDAGDFSMGSLFQTAFSTHALELRIMGIMGYDVTTFGNHDYDYLQSGLISMLRAAVASGDPLPAIVEANYLPPASGEEGYDPEMHAALEEYGVKDYMILERGGVYFVIFGIYGFDADDCAPNSGMVLYDPIETAQKTVDAAKAECLEKYGQEPVVICLSHSGTEDGKGEDYELAQKTEGIHVIVSGHTHTTLAKPITVNNTQIVSASAYSKYLGVLELNRSQSGAVSLTGYQLIPITEATPEDEKIAGLVAEFKKTVDEDYLSQYQITFDEVLVDNPYTFDTVNDVYATPHESTLCNIFSDAYKWAVEEATGKRVDLALTAAGVIRETLPVGAVTTSDVFNAASLGVGTEGELIAIYLTGADLKTVLEVDASVQPLMRSAQLFCSGVEYSFNTNRMIFNKVDYAMLRRDDGSLAPIEDTSLYLVVTGTYVGQMLGSVEETSMGLLSIIPRDEKGNPIDPQKLGEHVVSGQDGKPVKEWFAISSFLKKMGGTMDSAYAQPDGRKVVYSSWNPVELLSNANHFTFILLGVLLLVLGIISLILWLMIRRVRKKKAGKRK